MSASNKDSSLWKTPSPYFLKSETEFQIANLSHLTATEPEVIKPAARITMGYFEEGLIKIAANFEAVHTATFDCTEAHG